MRLPLAMIVLLLLAGCTTNVYTGASSPTGAAVVCPQDVRVCPDGTTVGRVGDDCAFAACPAGRTIVCDYADPSRDYIYRSASACTGMIISCPAGSAFYDQCGCGCIIPYVAAPTAAGSPT